MTSQDSVAVVAGLRRPYGAARQLRLLRDLQRAAGMLRSRGLRATLAHARTISAIRLHRWLVDGALQKPLPMALTGRTDIDAMTLRATGREEKRAAFHCAPVPSKIVDWALQALEIDPKHFHFIDIGSGWGYALLCAAKYPFRRVTGIEFARELHERACANVRWARSQGAVAARAIELRHQSALETELPDGPLVLFLYNPFGEPVMRSFLQRVERSVLRNPRPIVLLYVNPTEERLFVRPDVTPLPLSGRAARLLKWLSPFKVHAYCWGPLPPLAARSSATSARS